MRSSKSLYYIQFAHHNAYPMVLNAMKQAFGNDQWAVFNNFTYLVHSRRQFEDIRLAIGVHMADDIDDFMIMKLDLGTAMSTFTDRHDIIDFLKFVKLNASQPEKGPSQAQIDALLDKVSVAGAKALNEAELRLLSGF